MIQRESRLRGLLHRPPTLGPRFVVTLALIFAFLTVVRGIGWATATPGESMAVVVVDGLSYARLSPQRWGAVMIAVGLLVIGSYASRIHPVVWVAHGVAAVAYLTVTVGLAQAVIDLGSGWQHVGPVIGGVIWHAFVCWRTGPLPPRTCTEGDPVAASHRP